jgi:Amt family ammonium transporter
LLVPCKGVAFTFVYCFVVSGEEEAQGLDLAEHNERAYNL